MTELTVCFRSSGASVSSQDDIYDETMNNTGKPIPVRQFAEYVKSTKAADYARLKEEYKARIIYGQIAH